MDSNLEQPPWNEDKQKIIQDSKFLKALFRPDSLEKEFSPDDLKLASENVDKNIALKFGDNWKQYIGGPLVMTVDVMGSFSKELSLIEKVEAIENLIRAGYELRVKENSTPFMQEILNYGIESGLLNDSSFEDENFDIATRGIVAMVNAGRLLRHMQDSDIGGGFEEFLSKM